VCGILGILSLNGDPVEPEQIRRGLATLRHRGPDDEGAVFLRSCAGDFVAVGGPDTPEEAYRLTAPYAPRRGADVQGDVALGNRRLAVVDLSPAGHQPMCTEDGALWVTHNGEIYNFPELRAELQRLGHVFRSHTDTEVILHAYEEWGEAALHRFNGMWAFLLWDGRRRRLVCARDRFGVKPLYYAWTDGIIALASEPKAILATGLVRPEPNEALIVHYLAHGLVDHTDETFFAGIRAVPPGHVLVIEDGEPRIRRWYELPVDEPLLGLSEEEYAQRFAETLTDSVRIRLISDVPVGTALSGGLDSSSIACLVDELMRGQGIKLGGLDVQKTFSARYPAAPDDEGRYIDAVAAKTGVAQHQVEPSAAGLLDALDDLVHHQDEPFTTTSMYAQWEVYRLARSSGVIVTLDGQGGDETVGGYPHHRAALLLQLVRSGRLLRWLREARSLNGPVGPLFAQGVLSSIRLALPPAVRGPLLARRASRAAPAWLRAQRVPHPAAVYRHDRRIGDAFRSQLYLDLVTGLPSLLRYADRSSMAHSVEARLPFLDYRLVELAFALPNELRVGGGETKVVLRRAMAGVVPREVLDRRDKIAFSTPQDRWFRNDLRPFLVDVLGSPSFRSRPWFSWSETERALDAYFSGTEDRSAEVWRWLNLELWLRHFVDGEPRGDERALRAAPNALLK
jgi:asparagine synthase (glutamine-hydrolysing)